MKRFLVFLSVLLIVSSTLCAQDAEKRFFEDTPTLGGDVTLKAAYVNVEGKNVIKTFELENPADGAFYADAWIVAPLKEEGFPEYDVTVNGVPTAFSFKPTTAGWQSLALTNQDGAAARVKLKKGTNTLSIIGQGPEVPGVDFVKL